MIDYETNITLLEGILNTFIDRNDKVAIEGYRRHLQAQQAEKDREIRTEKDAIKTLQSKIASIESDVNDPIHERQAVEDGEEIHKLEQGNASMSKQLESLDDETRKLQGSIEEATKALRNLNEPHSECDKPMSPAQYHEDGKVLHAQLLTHFLMEALYDPASSGSDSKTRYNQVKILFPKEEDVQLVSFNADSPDPVSIGHIWKCVGRRSEQYSVHDLIKEYLDSGRVRAHS